MNILDHASMCYATCLVDRPIEKAFLFDRRILPAKPDTLVGYAYEGLVTYLASKGYSLEDMIESGLVIYTGDDYEVYFKDTAVVAIGTTAGVHTIHAAGNPEVRIVKSDTVEKRFVFDLRVEDGCYVKGLETLSNFLLEPTGVLIDPNGDEEMTAHVAIRGSVEPLLRKFVPKDFRTSEDLVEAVDSFQAVWLGSDTDTRQLGALVRASVSEGMTQRRLTPEPADFQAAAETFLEGLSLMAILNRIQIGIEFTNDLEHTDHVVIHLVSSYARLMLWAKELGESIPGLMDVKLGLELLATEDDSYIVATAEKRSYNKTEDVRTSLVIDRTKALARGVNVEGFLTMYPKIAPGARG